MFKQSESILKSITAVLSMESALLKNGFSFAKKSLHLPLSSPYILVRLSLLQLGCGFVAVLCRYVGSGSGHSYLSGGFFLSLES